MKRVADLFRPQPLDLDAFARRGFTRQHQRRQWEHTLRNNIVAFHDWVADLGWSRQQTADLLHLAPRTLRQWDYDFRTQAIDIKPLGRPTLRSSRQDRNATLGAALENRHRQGNDPRAPTPVHPVRAALGPENR